MSKQILHPRPRLGFFLGLMTTILFLTSLAGISNASSEEIPADSEDSPPPTLEELIETFDYAMQSTNSCDSYLRTPRSADLCRMGTSRANASAPAASYGGGSSTGPTLESRAARLDELKTFCDTERAEEVAGVQSWTEDAANEAITAALQAPDYLEVETVMTLAEDPYLDQALVEIAGLSSMDLGDMCQPTDEEISQATPSNRGHPAEYAAWTECHRKVDPPVNGRAVTAVGSTCYRPMITDTFLPICRSGLSQAAKRQCIEEQRVRHEEKIAEMRRQAQADEAACQKTEAARREQQIQQQQREEEQEQAQYAAEMQACVDEEKRKARSLREEQLKITFYQSCMRTRTQVRVAAICQAAGTSGASEQVSKVEAGWYAKAASSAPCQRIAALKIQAPSGWDPRSNRENIDFLVSSFTQLLPEPRLESCRQRLPRGETICKKLEAAARFRPKVIDKLYPPQTVERAKARFDETLAEVLQWIDQNPSLDAEEKALLKKRVADTELTIPSGSTGLYSLLRAGGGWFNCGSNPETVELCTSKQVQLSPALLGSLASSNPLIRARAEMVLIHEIGHGLAPIGQVGDQPFEKLSACLEGQVNSSGFTPENRPHIVGEAVADWLAGEMLAKSLGDGATKRERSKTAENNLASFACGVLNGTPYMSCTGGPAGVESYPMEFDPSKIPADLQGGCDETKKEYDHPLVTDRFHTIVSNPNLKEALGCKKRHVDEAACTL